MNFQAALKGIKIPENDEELEVETTPEMDANIPKILEESFRRKQEKLKARHG